MEDKLSFTEKLGYGLTNFGAGTWTSFINTFLLFFYTNVAHIRPAVASLIISLAVIWDAVNDPLIASVADNHRFGNGEKMRPLLWSGIPVAVCLVLCFTVFGKEGSTFAMVMAFVTYFVFRIPSTVHMLAANGMRQLASPVDGHRVSLGTWATGGGSFGMAVSSIVFWPVIRGIAGLDADGNMIEPRKGFLAAAVIAGLIVIATSLFNYFTSRERVNDEVKEKIPFLKSCRILFSVREFNLNLGMLFLYGLFGTIVSGYSLYYCTYVLDKPGIVSAVMATYVVGIIAALPFVNPLYKKLGRKKVIAVGTVILILGSVTFFVLAKTVIALFVLCACIGIGTEIVTVMLGLNRADITDEVSTKYGTRMDGMVNNVMYFGQKLGNALLTFILGLVLEFSGFDGDLSVQPAGAVSAIFFIVGITTLAASLGIGAFAAGLRMDDAKKE